MERHPHLKEKLQLAYELQLNPRITSNQDLARAIGKSRQAISRWCVGTETSRANSIPLNVTPKVAEALYINPEWLTLSLEEFTSRVKERLSNEITDSESNDLKVSISTLPITNVEIFGREDELQLLDQYWFDKKTNVVEIVAFGGSGKSSLVNAWLSRLSGSNYKGANRIYAWSFYWQRYANDLRSSGDYFIEHALDWFGDLNPTQGSPWSKAIRLANLIRKTKTLLILDGLEPLQNPPGERHGQITNIALSALIKDLAAENNGLCVISSRYAVSDLIAYRDTRSSQINLEGLSKSAAVNMLASGGLKGSDKKFLEAVEAYSGHALSLSLLIGYLNVVHGGDLDRLSKVRSISTERHNRNRIENLMNDYLGCFENEAQIQILRLVCLFDRTVMLSQLWAIIKEGLIDGLTDKLWALEEDEIRYAVKELDDANLVSIDQLHDDISLDCHPLVKDFIVEQLRRSDIKIYETGHASIFNLLVRSAVVTPETMNEYEPLFRAVSHATKANLFKEAYDVYHSRIKKGQFMLFANGSHHADQACIASFLNDEGEFITDQLGEEAEAYILISAATNQINLGNTIPAIELSKRSIDWFLKKERWLEASVAAAPLLSMLIAAGQLDAASSLVNEMSEVVGNTDNEILRACAENFSAYIAFLGGDILLAHEKFILSEKTLGKPDPRCAVTFPTISSYYCKFLLESVDPQSALDRSLKTFAWRERTSWQVTIDATSILASDLLVLGLTFLKLGDKSNAFKHLDRQVELFRASDEWLYLPTGLNSRARYYAAVKNFDAALNDLHESIEIATETGAKFGEWEAHLDMAQVYLAMNDKELSSKSLERAKQMSSMDQYKFRDHEIAELESKLAMH